MVIRFVPDEVMRLRPTSCELPLFCHMEKPLTRQEVAELFGISLRTLANYIQAGRLPAPYLTIRRVNYWRIEQLARHLMTTPEALMEMKNKRGERSMTTAPSEIPANEFERSKDTEPAPEPQRSRLLKWPFA
jgi:hypothetical protein